MFFNEFRSQTKYYYQQLVTVMNPAKEVATHTHKVMAILRVLFYTFGFWYRIHFITFVVHYEYAYLMCVWDYIIFQGVRNIFFAVRILVIDAIDLEHSIGETKTFLTGMTPFQ